MKENIIFKDIAIAQAVPLLQVIRSSKVLKKASCPTLKLTTTTKKYLDQYFFFSHHTIWHFEIIDQLKAELWKKYTVTQKLALGLNLEPLAYESCALPMSYTEKMEKIVLIAQL